MHSKYKNLFVCPECSSKLDMVVFDSEGCIIIDGLFTCRDNNHFYPIINGIPRFLTLEMIDRVLDKNVFSEYVEKYATRLPRTLVERKSDQDRRDHTSNIQASVAGIYSYLWEKYNTDFDSSDQAEFMRLTGGLLTFNEFKNQSVIDVGSGQGRHITPALAAGVKEIVCVDLGNHISLAHEKHKENTKVLCVQADVYNLPLMADFDLVMNIGVLHHLPDPAKGFDQLVKLAKKGGLIFAWCYGDSTLKKAILLLRRIVNALPAKVIWFVSGIITIPRYFVSWAGKKLRELGFQDLADMLPMSVYENYHFHYLHTNTFDHLATKIINFFKKEDIEMWLANSHINDFKIIERFPNSVATSWVIIAKKD